MLNTTELSNRAFALGKDAGRAAGSWIVDGNTSSEIAQRIIEGYEEGDPQIMDLEPACLSGEWADEPTPDTLADELGLTDEYRGTELDQLCTEYELGFGEGFWDEVIRAAKYIA